MKILYLLIATLKFLGITILLLLLLLLLSVIIILIVPIKYSVYVNKSEDIYLHTTVKWLYSIVGMDIIYNSGSEITTKFKLFGIGIGRKKPNKFKKPQELKTTVKPEVKLDTKPDEPIPTRKREVRPEKKGRFKDVINQIQAYTYKKELLTDTISWVGKILKRIRPSTLYMEIEIGKEDPADTGQLIGMISALYPLYYSFATIIGNYEKECFYGKINAKGHITLGQIVYDLIKYIRTKSVKQLIKFIKKDRKGKKDERKIRK